ncbi:unnamed protein product, partial [Prorocentrum cordatum]
RDWWKRSASASSFCGTRQRPRGTPRISPGRCWKANTGGSGTSTTRWRSARTSRTSCRSRRRCSGRWR